MAFVPVVLIALLMGLTPIGAIFVARHRCSRHILARKAVTRWSILLIAAYYAAIIIDYSIVFLVDASMGEEHLWPLQFAGCVLLLLGPGLALWIVISGPERFSVTKYTDHCAQCGYLLELSQSSVCPECGHAPDASSNDPPPEKLRGTDWSI